MVMRKAQMFVITMIFLAGLIFTVQNSLYQYSLIDLADTFSGNDAYILRGVKSSFESSINTSPTCEKITENLMELEAFLEKKFVMGSSIDIDYTLDCIDPGQGSVNVTIRSRSIDVDATETVSI